MSKVRSALGEMVDFEMMDLMASYGAQAPKINATSKPSPTPTIMDLPPQQPTMMGTPQMHQGTVVEQVQVQVVSRDVEVEEPAQSITIESPASVDDSLKSPKRGVK
jgi:hypothetical protein